MLWTFSGISGETYELPTEVFNFTWFVCTKNSGQNNLWSGENGWIFVSYRIFRLRYVFNLQINIIIRLLRACAYRTRMKEQAMERTSSHYVPFNRQLYPIRLLTSLVWLVSPVLRTASAIRSFNCRCPSAS